MRKMAYGGARPLSLLVFVTVVALAGIAYDGQADDGQKRSGTFLQEEQRRTGQLRAIARELREAILRRDIEALLRYETRGEQVGRLTYNSYTESQALLADPRSWLYCQLFDTQCRLEQLRESEGIPGSNPYRISVAEFFQKHPHVEIKIHFFGTRNPDLGMQGVLDLAQIAYVVPGSSLDRRFPNPLREDFPVKKWGKEYVDTCLQHTRKGWRYYANIFICPSD